MWVRAPERKALCQVGTSDICVQVTYKLLADMLGEMAQEVAASNQLRETVRRLTGISAPGVWWSPVCARLETHQKSHALEQDASLG
jgi:hypothetical protein